MANANPSSLTAEGTNAEAFGPTEWSLLFTTSTIWGSSFLWIAIALDSLHPSVIAFVRLVLGAIVLIVAGQIKQKIRREHWMTVVAIAVVGNAMPGLLFGFAEQRLSSSVAGMIQSASPLMVLMLAVLLLGKTPGRIQVMGLILGLAGAVMLSVPSLSGGSSERLGVLLVLIAVLGYSMSSTLLVPLSQEYGGPTIVGWALIVSAVLMIPYGLWGFGESTFEWKTAGAVLMLGVFSTGIARALFANLLARAGAPRASLVSYMVPLVAIILGVTFRGDEIFWQHLVGLAMVLTAARMISRAEARAPSKQT